jgi:DNA-binding NtrC family response regulator
MQRRVLVVDDESTIRLTTAAILETKGFEVQTASCTQEALAAMSAVQFDLIVTDLKMETDTAGFDVAEFAAKQTSHPIIIMVSAYPKLATDWKEHGVHAFFEKPTETLVLLRSIEELLSRQHKPMAA